MSANVDERLLGQWLDSRRRQERARDRLAKCALPAERFEGWALELLAEALSTPGAKNLARASRAVRPLLLEDGGPGRK